jgi:hypothetical protein
VKLGVTRPDLTGCADWCAKSIWLLIKAGNRPFTSVDEMDAEIIRRHNEVVGPKHVVIHAGDFSLLKKPFTENYIRQLYGTHKFCYQKLTA